MTEIAVQPPADPYRTPAAAKPPKRRSGWTLFFIAVAGTVVGLLAFLFLLFAVFSAVGAAGGDDDGLGNNTVLSLDLRQPFSDTGTSGGLFGAAPPSVVDTVRKLRAAQDDSRVEGLFVRAGFGMSPAAATEIGGAIREFRDSGKFVVGFAQGFDSTSPTAYAPVAPSELWMQASTDLFTSGYRSESEHYKGLIEKIGADEEFFQFYEYKSAADTYNDESMTEPAREASLALITSLFDTAVEDVAASRDLSEARVRELWNTAPHSAADAVEAGLVDELGHLEAARRRARELAGDDDAPFVSVASYRMPSNIGAPTLALVSGQGAIVPGESQDASPFGGGVVTFGSDTVAKAIDDAVDNDNVRAIVFRVSSPGGSAAASDQVHAAVARAREAGKPVVVSMGSYAASGGYYVSANADSIVALPSTVTGSIGVLGGKVAFEGAFDKVGIEIDQVDVGGPATGMWSLDTPFSDYQEQAWYGSLEDIYEDFTRVVAEGRDMTQSRVHEIAKGRVWTGEQALELGLVDELGGIHRAVEVAKELAEIGADEAVRLRRYPAQLSVEEQLLRLVGGVAQTGEDVAELRALMDSPEVKALIRARDAATAGGPDATLRARLPFID